jgi:hypothetical protein
LGGTSSTHDRCEKYIKILQKSESNRPLERAKFRWEDSIKLKKNGMRAWSEFIWFRIMARGWLL